ncbi:MAG: hypothetical protein RJA47_1118 [Actinomycetota bacterium]|jgi:Xaa-Pro aminopeptidase
MARVKTPAELASIERAAGIADDALAKVVGRGIVGFTEREVRDLLEAEMSRLGSDAPSFPTIVAAGTNGVHPHHEPTDAVVAAGDMVVIDMGATVGGWMSDMTRTVRVGPVSAELEEMHVLVRAAQEAGLAAVRPGVSGREVDEAVRAVFRAAGVEHEFVHGTGHGVGTVIHEQPILNRSCETTLLEGEVVTVEPGLYREGVGGVRIEDLVVVTTTGCRSLTRTPKELSCPPSAPTT